jgi:phosphopantothenoylcysteine decarboxylase/phosphopantothenate--cysteine ligase
VGNKKVLLCVSGGIAAYKSINLMRSFQKQGFDVSVALSESAKNFVSKIAFKALTAFPVIDNLFDEDSISPHIELTRWADVVVVAPTTANTISKIAHGRADSLISACVISSKKPVVIFPAMHEEMWINSVVQENILSIKNSGHTVINPQVGELASGDFGEGRLPSDKDIIFESLKALTPQILKDQKIIVTSGGSVTKIDPVRCITNFSSGKMGTEVAKWARLMGAEVTHIKAGRDFRTNDELLDQLEKTIDNETVLFMVAAPNDYEVIETSDIKIKRTSDELTINLKKSKDILAYLTNDLKMKFVVGFAAETNNHEMNAKQKIVAKNLDVICVNNVVGEKSAFGSDENELQIISKSGEILMIERTSKSECAKQLCEYVSEQLS